MAQQKLYTEEQVREAFDNGYKYASTLRPTAIEEHYKYVDNSIKSLTSIELPSDEEIEKAGTELFDKGVDIDYGWIMGAKWMRDKILNK